MRLAIKRFQERRQARLDARFDEEEIWRTTDKGKHYAMNGKGEITKGPKAMVGKNISEVREVARKNAEARRSKRATEVENNLPVSEQTLEKNKPFKGKKSQEPGRLGHIYNKSKKNTAFTAQNIGVTHHKELSAHVLNDAMQFYNTASDVAEEEHNTFLATFTDHGVKHILEVANKSQEAADAIDEIVKGDGFYQPVDRKTLQVAALLHDVGMDGDDHVDYSSDNGNAVRADHPMNSAIHVLEMADTIKKYGVDPETVALVVLTHSKSCSGLSDLRNEADWSHCVDELRRHVEIYNDQHPNNPIDFDISKFTDGSTHPARRSIPALKKQEKIWNNTHSADEPFVPRKEAYNFDKKKLGEMVSMAAALRLGDANRDAPEIPITQSGRNISLDWKSYKSAPDGLATLEDRANAEGFASRAFLVGKNGNIIKPGTDGFDMKGMSRKTYYGEGNISSMKTSIDHKEGKMSGEYTIKDPKLFPCSTQAAIAERVGEMATMGIPCVVKVYMPEGTKQEIKQNYKDALNQEVKNLMAQGYPADISINVI